MKSLSRYIALFLTLVVLSNGLFAAQMTLSMIEDASQSAVSEEKLPCHGDKSEILTDTAEMDCCQGDCGDCVSSTSLNQPFLLAQSDVHQLSGSWDLADHILLAHQSNLYRPPILI